MPSKMRHAILISMTMIALLFASVIVSYAETVNYIYDEINRLIRVEYGDGTKIMYTYDEAGNRQYVGLLDTVPPVTTATPPGGTYGTAQSVTLTCNDDISGCNKIYYTTNGNDPTESSPIYSAPINISVTTTLKFFAKDLAGNSESVKTQTYTIDDTTPPTGTITINSGAASTDNVNVTLTLTCDDAQGCAQMKFSNDVDNESNYSTPETYAATKAWTLTTGDGTKTVYAKFKDAAGNWSSAYSDTINFTDSYTKSFLHMNGTDQSTTFTDSATGGTHTWTAYGNAKLTTADKKFGSASGTFDGSGDYISSPYSADFNFGSGNFTIDLWFKRLGGIGTNQYLGLYSSAGAGIGYFMIQIYTNNKIYLTFWDTSNASHQLVGTTAITDTGTWHHLAFVRNGSTITEYIDGTACGTHNIGALAIYNNTQWGPAWGRMGNYSGQTFNGKLDEVRISKGIARWTSNFTPPSDDGTITINSGAASTDNVNVTLTLTCDDAQGCAQMKFSNDVDNESNYSTPETYAATKAWTLTTGDGTKTVYAKFKDAAGNWSTAYSDSILLDTTPPTYTKSLLHMNGTDQSTTFTDDAVGGSHTWTAYGNAKLTTADKKFGSASGTFDGSGDYISSPYSADFNFGSGDFTIDLWFKRSGGIGTNQYLGLYSSAGAGIGYFMIQIYTDNKFYLTFWDTSNASHQLVGTTAITDTGTWHHLAFVRNGSTITEYIDGTACGTHNIGALAIYNNTQWGPAWGRMGNYSGQTFNGKLDEVRISKGIAHWTSNFTPPSDEY